MHDKLSVLLAYVQHEFCHLGETATLLNNDLTDMLITKARGCRMLPSFDLDAPEFCNMLRHNTRFITYLREASWVHEVVKDYVNAPDFYELGYGDFYGLGTSEYKVFSESSEFIGKVTRSPFSFYCYKHEVRGSLKSTLAKIMSASERYDFISDSVENFLPALQGKNLLVVTPTSECVLTCASADISGAFDNLSSLVAYIKDNLTNEHFTNEQDRIEFLVTFDCEVRFESQIDYGPTKVLKPRRKYQSLTSILIAKGRGPRSFTAYISNTLTNTNEPSLCKDIFSCLL